MNMELNRVLKEERMVNEDMKVKLIDQMEKLKEKIINIENGCARDIVLKLKALRNETIYKVDKSLV